MNRRASPPTPVPPRASAPRAPLGGVLACLGAYAAVLYLRQLFLGQTFVLRDHVIYTWTERLVLARGLRTFGIPEWNDLVGFGTQFAASSANGVTYPPLWIVALFPLPFSMDLVVAVHVLLTGIGAALLARRLGAEAMGATFAGLALMGSGYVASIAPNKVFVGTAWIPWIAWAADRLVEDASRRAAHLRGTSTLAAMMAVQHLAGDPASSITGALVALAVTLARAERRRAALARLAVAASASLPLAAAGILPGLALLPHTTRAAVSPFEATSWSLHPWRLLELVWPRALGDPVDPAANIAQVLADAGSSALEPSWSFSAFLGAPVLALAALGAPRGQPARRGLWLGAGALVLLALGAYTPVYHAWRTIFIPERIIRYPEKHLAGAVVLLCALAGAGVSALRDRSGRAAAWTFAAAAAPLALALVGLALFRTRLAEWIRPAPGGFATLDVRAALGVSLRAGGLALAVAAAAALLFLAARGRRLVGAAAVVAVAAHLAYESWAVTPVAPAARLTTVPRLLERLARPRGEASPPPRLLRSPLVDAELAPAAQAEYRHETLVLDSPGRFGVAALPGFEGWRSRELAALWARAGNMPIAAFQTLFSVDAVALPSELRRTLFPSGSGRGTGVLAQLILDASSEDGRWSLVHGEGIRPRAFVAPRWSWSSFEGAIASTVEGTRGTDPGLVVLTGAGAPSPPENASLPLTPCDIVRYRPERVELSCSSAAKGFAVLVDENAAGWTASVDGVDAKIETADVLLRAVEVGPGSHRIVLRYRTPWLRAGVFVSVASWIAWVWIRRRGARHSTRPRSGH